MIHHTAYVVAREDLEAAREDLERRGLPAFLHSMTGEIDSTMHDAAANQIFNIANGDVYVWENIWPRLAQLFGM